MKYFEYIKEYIPYIRGEVSGSSIEEIELTEKQLNIKFPIAYREYLLLFGKNSGSLHEPDQCNLNELSDMQIEANEIFKREVRLYHPLLKPTELVIVLHLNYSFFYLTDIDKHENPPVWLYVQGDEIHEYKEAENFTDFIYKCLKIEATYNEKLWQKFKSNGIEIEIPSWMKQFKSPSKSMKVNIIGAGISGLSAGCYLQMNGFETEIFEKHAIPGGLCTSWKKNGYMIDGCAHWIMGSAPGSSFYKLYNELLDMPNIPFINHDVRMVIEVKNSVDKYGSNQFKLYTNLNKLQAYLLDLSPEDAHLILPFIKSMRDMQKFDLPPIMDELPFIQATIRGIKMARYLEFFFILMKWRNETNYTFGAKFKNPFLREAFHFLYDNEEVKLMVMMMPLAFFDLKSCGYPIGGSIGFAKRFEERYLELGGKIQYKKCVKEIVVENDEAKGILLHNDTFVPSDITLSTADWKFTVFDLLKGKYVTDKLVDLKDGKMLDVFYSVVQVSFGINKDLSDLPHFFRYPLEEAITSPDGTVYKRMEVHLYHYDPTMAPSGKTTVVVSFYTVNREFWIDLRTYDRKHYREVKTAFTQVVLDKLDKRLGGIKDKVEMMDMATPATIMRYTNNWKGSTQGWLPSDNLVAPSPVKQTLPKLKNFYYASHWSQPGGGLPIAVIAARDVTKYICKQHKKKFTVVKK